MTVGTHTYPERKPYIYIYVHALEGYMTLKVADPWRMYVQVHTLINI
jgi:hypothetical protein